MQSCREGLFVTARVRHAYVSYYYGHEHEFKYWVRVVKPYSQTHASNARALAQYLHDHHLVLVGDSQVDSDYRQDPPGFSRSKSNNTRRFSVLRSSPR